MSDVLGVNDDSSPTLSRIELGAELRRLREASGRTIEQVSRALSDLYGPGFSSTKLSRLETGKRPASQRDVRDLCLYYETSSAYLDRLVQLAKATRGPSGWRGLTDAYAEYLALESVASAVRTYESMLVPGLLQTSEYSRALAAGDAFDQTATEGEGEDLDIKIDVRAGRQKRLNADRPLKLHAIIDEIVIRRVIGDAGIMARQLRHMSKIAAQDNVVLQVVPFTVGAHPGLESAGFAILDFVPGTQVQDYVCFLEGIVGIAWVEREAERLRVLRVFEYMKVKASSPDDTRELIDSAVHDLGV